MLISFAGGNFEEAGLPEAGDDAAGGGECVGVTHLFERGGDVAGEFRLIRGDADKLEDGVDGLFAVCLGCGEQAADALHFRDFGAAGAADIHAAERGNCHQQKAPIIGQGLGMLAGFGEDARGVEEPFLIRVVGPWAGAGIDERESEI